MKIAFYAPLKPMSHPNPSGDRAIARDLFQFLAENGNTLFVTNEFRTRWFWREFRLIREWFVSLLSSLKATWYERPEIFFTYHMYYKAPDPIQPILSLLFRKPYVLYEASLAPKARKTWKTLPGYLWTRFALWRADRIYTNMSEDFELLSKVYGKKVKHIPPSIDVERFRFSEQAANRVCEKYELSPAKDRTRILCAAMMRDQRKTEGVRILVSSVVALLEAEPSLGIELVIAGAGKNQAAIEALVPEFAKERIRFLGAVPREDMVGLYSASQLFAFPGIDEGFGLVYLEAQSCGLPVLAMDNGGVPDAVDKGRTAVLTKLGDELEFKTALLRLIQDEDLRTMLSANARSYVLERHNREANYRLFVEEMNLLCRIRRSL